MYLYLFNTRQPLHSFIERWEQKGGGEDVHEGIIQAHHSDDEAVHTEREPNNPHIKPRPDDQYFTIPFLTSCSCTVRIKYQFKTCASDVDDFLAAIPDYVLCARIPGIFCRRAGGIQML
jgi:hypothetical protein